ncbi:MULTISPECIES: TetR/AcrR family transcriptional regulator [unclassified Roseitalea]|uniref:TetR/AcrR family transcriptional regulator n=1 Tax=unclassified Roseitalea TaxID=2639107 RepID=UPI00273F6BAA|nr:MULTISPECIES: TetR/AcrR family transcriptional regulator [unclassified Roseitalea]
MLDCVVDGKRGTILKAALEVFVTYGFRKTSMDDIARAAGMSRPALYQVFRNKSEIFRALAGELMGGATANAEAAFEREGSFRDRLLGAIDCSILRMHRFVEDTPHGVELIGINEEIAADIAEKWEATMAAAITRAVEQAARRGEVSLDRFGADATTIGRIFVLALAGLKREVQHGRPVEPHVQALVDFFADALEAR